MQIIKKGTIVSLCTVAMLSAASAFADYTTSFTTSSINPYNYDGAWGPGDCGWELLGTGGYGNSGGAGYGATKDCPYSNQTVSWNYNSSGYYNVSVRQYGEPYCQHGTEQVPVTTYEERCAAP